MTKDNTTRTERVRKANRDFKNHVRASKRKKEKHVRKQENLESKAREEYLFRQHMARLLSDELGTRLH